MIIKMEAEVKHLEVMHSQQDLLINIHLLCEQ